MFDNLTSTQFEDFCYSLLKLQGLENVDWRKGTNKDTSPSDNGRDIECEYHRYDNILQRTVIEKWFVECKHHKEGISPDKIQGALSWAQAERPHRLILVASGFFSNPCKDYIQKYKNENKPTFEIEMWEKPKVEKMVWQYPWLLKAFDIEGKDELLNFINYYHIRYIKENPFTSFDILKQAVNQLPQLEKDRIFEQIFIYYISNDDLISNMDHKATVIKNLEELVSQKTPLYINSFINNTCNVLLSYADPARIDKCICERENMKVIFAKRNNKELLETFNNSYNNYRLNKEVMLNLYNSFCDIVVRYILENPYIPNIGIEYYDDK